MKVTVMLIVIGALGTVPQRIDKGTGGIGNKNMSGDHPNYSIIKIGQNTEKSPGDMRRHEETCCHSNCSGRPLANANVKNSQRRKMIIQFFEIVRYKQIN